MQTLRFFFLFFFFVRLVVKTATGLFFPPAFYFRGENLMREVRKYKVKQEAVMLSEAMSHNHDYIYFSLPRWGNSIEAILCRPYMRSCTQVHIKHLILDLSEWEREWERVRTGAEIGQTDTVTTSTRRCRKDGKMWREREREREHWINNASAVLHLCIK